MSQPNPTPNPRAGETRWGRFLARRRQGTVLMGELLGLIGACAVLSAAWFPGYVGHAPLPPKDVTAAALKRAYAPPPDSWIARNPLTGQMQRYYRVCAKRRFRHHHHPIARPQPMPIYALPYGVLPMPYQTAQS